MLSVQRQKPHEMSESSQKIPLESESTESPAAPRYLVLRYSETFNYSQHTENSSNPGDRLIVHVWHASRFFSPFEINRIS